MYIYYVSAYTKRVSENFLTYSRTWSCNFPIFFLFRKNWKPGEMLKDGQTYFKNPAVFTPQDF